MLKDLFFVCLRSALGFLLIAPVFMFASQAGHMPETSFTSPSDPIFIWFFNGTMVAWLAGTLLNILQFMKLAPRKLKPLFALAPIHFPLLYALIAYLWFFRDQIL